MKVCYLKIFTGIAAGILFMFSGCLCEDSDSKKSPISLPYEGETFLMESGFLRGHAVSTIASVEVSFDGGDYAAATGTTEWTFPLPAGAVSWKTGSVHEISVRGVYSGGGTTDELTVTVRKGPNRDVNGDGYPELALGAYHYGYIEGDPDPNNEGRVYLFNGSSAGPGSSPSQIIESPDPDNIAGFGKYIVLDDFNGDGYGDMAAADHDYNSYNGHVYIFYGSSSGLASTAGTTLTGASNSNFGWSLCSGDFNGDNFTDIAIGAPYDDGAVHVFYGSSSNFADCDLSAGGTADRSYAASIGSIGSETLGSSVIAGDFNGDEYADLAALAGDGGYVEIYNGSNTGLPASYSIRRSSSLQTDTSPGCLASGNVNGDAYDDLAVGAVSYVSSTGRVYVFHGRASGISDTADPEITLTGEFTSDHFGTSLSIADTDKDGYGDLAIGARNFQNSSSGDQEYGAVYVYKGSSAGIETPYSTRFFEAAEEMDYLGTLVYFSDITGDGFIDLYSLAEGYIYEGSDTGDFFGRAYLYSGTAAGISFDDPWYFDAEFSVP
ncbi:MAG: FG-GAP repeat protein [Spirochaetes bacterium]|nr:FG-GAP repeat protein [Spirochaetota bacterium]